MSRAPNALPIHKIVVIGSGGVGKSALTLRYMYDEFHDEYVPTKIGQFSKEAQLSSEEACMIEIIDTAGEEELKIRKQQNYAISEGIIFVYAINDIDSYHRVKELYEDVMVAKTEIGQRENFDILLVGNKSDMGTNRQVLRVEGEHLASKWGCEYIETSAKLDEFVSNSFQLILSKVHDRKFKVPEQKAKKKKKKNRNKKFKLNCFIV
ncbi:Small GTP-binding protein domain [Oopsacas minuta]|uniref:Small GTP-binding protein domain n=1 Tax=Oopsacas minuta TaxID=111878 RepID=A0AAV7JK88_9METZ|nr:Small GTP-binding protein domain [Oopsacas minuta]